MRQSHPGTERLRSAAGDLVRQYFDAACPCAFPRAVRLAAFRPPGPNGSIDASLLTAALFGLEGPPAARPFELVEQGTEALAPAELRGSGYAANRYACPVCGSTWVVVFEEWSIAVSRHAAFLLDARAATVGAPAEGAVPLVRGLYGHTAEEVYRRLVRSKGIEPLDLTSFIAYMKAPLEAGPHDPRLPRTKRSGCLASLWRPR